MSLKRQDEHDNMSEDMDDRNRDKTERGGTEVGDDEYNMLIKVMDTTSAKARRGKNIQGIPWDRLNISRENYRKTRLEQYKNYENVPSSGDTVDKEYRQVEKSGNYYEFFRHTRLVKPTILHFQQLDQKGVSFCTRATVDVNAIMNSLEIYDSSRQIHC